LKLVFEVVSMNCGSLSVGRLDSRGVEFPRRSLCMFMRFSVGVWVFRFFFSLFVRFSRGVVTDCIDGLLLQRFFLVVPF